MNVPDIPVGQTTVVVTANGSSSNAVSFKVIPTITAISLNYQPVGTAITITGIGFGSAQNSSTVTFNGAVGSVNAWSDTSVTAAVPAAASNGPLSILVNSLKTNGVWFYVAPHIDSVSPTSAAVGSSITVTGSGFGNSFQQYVTAIAFNGVAATPTTWTNTSITLAVPAGATTGNVVVTDNVDSNGIPFTVMTNPPTITGVTGTIQAGGQFDIQGTFLDNPQGSSSIALNGVTLVADNWSDTAINTVHVPASIAPGGATLQVTTPAGISNSFNVTIIPLPNITSISPTSGQVGSLLTITGTNFGNQQGERAVMNGVGSMPIVSWSDTMIIVTVPDNANSQTLYVVAAGGSQSNNSQQFTVVNPPLEIIGISPLEALPGELITVSGLSFGGTGSGGSVSIDGQIASPSSWSDTQIAVPAPTASGSHSIAIVNSAGTVSEAKQFRVLALGSISGTVMSNGLPIQGAIVRGAFGNSAISDANGQFTLPSVAAGTYSLGANATGFVPTTNNQVSVNAGQDTAVSLTMSQPNPVTVSIAPSTVNLMFGVAADLTLYDQDGMPVKADSWAIDDPTIAQLDTTNGQPQVTGIGEGVTTVHAMYKGQQFDSAVTAVSSGATLKTATLPGSAVFAQPNVTLSPSASGPDIVWSEAGNLIGAHFDGSLVWQRPLLSDTPQNLAADASGNFVAVGSSTIAKYSGRDGLPQWVGSRPLSQWSSESSSGNVPVAVDGQGNVYSYAPGNTASSPEMVELDSATGRILRTVSLPKSYLGHNADDNCTYRNNELGQIYVQPDGSAEALVAAWTKPTPCPGFNDEFKSLYLMGFDASGNPFFQKLDTAPYEAPFLSGVTAGTVVPDADGETIVSWSRNTTAETGYHFLNTTTGASSVLGGTFGAQQTILGTTGILYYNTVNAFGTSDAGSLIAIDSSSFKELWRQDISSLLNNGNPLSSTQLETTTPDGGVVLFANSNGGSAAYRFDSLGNLVPDTALVPNSEYVGGPDGTLWLQYGAGPQGQTIQVSNPHDWLSLDAKLSIWPAAPGTMQAYFSGPSIHFAGWASDKSLASCSGFDDAITPNVLVVPQNGSNNVLLHVDKSFKKTVLVLVSDTPTVTLCPASTDGNSCSSPASSKATVAVGDTVYTVFGGTTAGLARIKVEDAAGKKVYTKVRVAVKKQLAHVDSSTRQYALDLYQVTDPTEPQATASSAPSATSIKAELDKIFLKQANINVTVSAGNPLSIHYDTMPHGQPDGKMQAGTSEVIVNTTTDPNAEEENNFLSYISQTDASGNLVNASKFISIFDQMVFYVHDINPSGKDAINGFTQLTAPLAWVRDKGLKPPSSTTVTGGFSSNGTSFTWSVGHVITTFFEDYTQENVTAHELGHDYGLTHNTDLNDLMFANSHNGCRLHANKEWHLLNPTEGEIDYDLASDTDAAKKNKQLDDDDEKVIPITTP